MQDLKDEEKAAWPGKERTASMVEGTACLKEILQLERKQKEDRVARQCEGRRAAGNEAEDQGEPDYAAARGSQLRV